MDTPNPQLSLDTRFIKRSKLSPWNTAAKEGSPAARQATPRPALIVGDIPQTTPVPSTVPRGQVNGQQMRRTTSGTPTPSATGSAKGDSDGQQKKSGTKLFSSHPKLQAMQKEWEKKDAEAKNAEAVARNKQQNVYNAPGAGEDDSDSTSTDSSSSDDETESDEEPQVLSKKASLGPDTVRRSSTHVPLPAYAFNQQHNRPASRTESHPPAAKRQSTGSAERDTSSNGKETMAQAQIKSEHVAYSTAPMQPFESIPPAIVAPQAVAIARPSSTSSESSSDDLVTVNGTQMQIIHETSEGRNYKEYHRPDGVASIARGCVIPHGYEPLDVPNAPWICPVRDCRKRLSTLKALAGHFGPSHRKKAFNDNGDGTLSLIGSYDSSSGGTCPAIVVSRGPVPAGAAPLAEPSFPAAAAAAAQRNDRAVVPLRDSDKATKLSASGRPGLRVAKRKSDSLDEDEDPITYLQSVLAPDQSIPSRGDVEFLSLLRRERDLPDEWLRFHGNKNLDSVHYACALAFIVGTEAATPCTKQYETGRLSNPCIVLPHYMGLRDKQVFSTTVTCVGCQYRSYLQRQTNVCDFREEIVLPNLQRERGGGRKRESLQSASDMALSPAPMAAGLILRPPSQNPRAQASPQPVANSLTTADRMRLDALSSRRAKAGAPSAAVTPTPSQPAFSQPVAPPRPEPVVNVGGSAAEAASSAEMLKMEDWEFAPGRQVSAATRETVAFSSVYLTGTNPVTIAPDISFNRLRLSPGGYHHWQADENSLRYCEVIAGKIEVKYPDTTLTMGPGGIFVLRPGMSCTVENRLYVEAVLSCHTTSNYSFQ